MSQDYRKDSVPIPPKDAKVFPTCCDYCIVACGYNAYVWPVGREGGEKASENAFGVDYPSPALSGRWASPNQHNIVMREGKKHHVLVVPDGDAVVVNRGGNHSIRGGCIAQKCYTPDGPTKVRLHYPMMRINGKLERVSWDTALSVMADVSKHVVKKYGEIAWGMKTFSYQFFENTYAISKIAFLSMNTPAYAPHDKPGPGNDTAGIDDAGIKTFSASYEDWSLADVIYCSGTDPYETKTVLFTEWWMKGYPNKIILALPRRTTGAAFAEKNGGLWLDVIPGSDTILHLAIARLILENGWEDKEFIEKYIASKWDIYSGFGRGTRNTPWQWRTTWGKLGTDFAGYKKWLLSYKLAELDEAVRITGVSPEKIKKTAELLAKPVGGKRPKASFAFEKGCYWSNNYLNTASLASLALICGAGNRPGQMVSRLGGHQRGWASKAAGYPRIKSPEKFPGRRKKEIDLDRWVESGNLRFAWVIGTTWVQAMAASQELAKAFMRMTRENPHQITSERSAAMTLKKRVDSGGMVVVDQDIYLRDPIGKQIADIVFPAATWGEEDFTRANGERRLRMYSKFYDPPGEAKPDWWIIAQFAKKMGFEGYDWKTSNDVFEEGARFSRGGLLDYFPLVWKAWKDKVPAHEMLRQMGSTGLQCPIRYVKGKLVGTKRLHDSTADFGTPEGPTVHKKWLYNFNTQSGKAILHKSPWELFSDFYERITPKGDELWVTNGRINEIWQSVFDDVHKKYIMDRWPSNWVEIHPDDARKRGIESGDQVVVENNDVLVQTGGFVGVDMDDLSYTALEKAGHIRIGKGAFRGVAMVSPDVKKGVLFTYFMWLSEPVNSVVHRVADPLTNRYRFKLGKGKIRKVGESPYKKDLSKLTFAPRTVL
jgi:arsenite oxidase large subunit